MRIGIASPIPAIGSMPGPSRPGWPSGGAFEFKIEFQGPGTFSYNGSRADGSTSYSLDLGDGTTYSSLGAGAITHTFGAGTFTILINSKEDSGPLDNFQLTGTQANKNRVTKILNWGRVPWRNLNTAFQNCHGLISVDKSDFYSDVSVNLTSAFENCDNLATVDFTGWKATGLTSLSSWFKDCTSLTSFLMKGNINLNPSTASHNSLFENSGAATGCSFNMDNINFSTTTGSQQTKQWFYNSNIKIDSKLTNWTFPAANWNLEDYFFDANIIGDNATLDISNWTLPNNSSTVIKEMFRNFSVNGTGTEQVVNMTNWNFGSIASLQGFLQGTGIRRVTGLSTWIANGLTNITNILNSAVNFSIDANDNFSSSFWNNSNISLASTMFFNMGSLTDASSAGAFPNLSGATFTNANFWTQSFFSCHFNTNASFSGVNFNGGDYNFYQAFQSAEFFNSNSTIDFSNTSISFANVERTFRQCKVNNIIFGDNVDFSNCTSFRFSFRFTGDSTVTFPMPTVTFPINSNRPNYSSATNTDSYPAIDFTTCQADNLVRALHDTGGTASGSATTFNLKDSQVTGAPSVVNSYLDNVLPGRGWTMTTNSTDAALPFTYNAAFDNSGYFVNPSAGSLQLLTSPPLEDRNFTSTNANVQVNQSTGELTWTSGTTGSTTVRCTYADGCYNEVSVSLVAPMMLKIDTSYDGGGLTARLPFAKTTASNNVAVNWGDGNFSYTNEQVWQMQHTYSTSGVKSIEIFGQGFILKRNEPTGYRKLKSFDSWGDYVWINPISGVEFGFFGSNSGTETWDYAATDAPNFSGSNNNISRLFNQQYYTSGRPTLSGSLASWDITKVTNMYSLFEYYGGRDDFLTPTCGIDQWDTRNVTNMSNMFRNYGGGSNTLALLANWRTDSVTTLSAMVSYTNVTSGTDSNGVYQPVDYLNTKVVNEGTAQEYIAWNVSNVTNFSYFNSGRYNYINLNIDKWQINTDAANNVSFTYFSQGYKQNAVMTWGPNSHQLSNIGCANIVTNDTHTTRSVTLGTTNPVTYTAWDMSRVSGISQFTYAGFGRNMWYISVDMSTWNLTNITSLDNFVNSISGTAGRISIKAEHFPNFQFGNVTAGSTVNIIRSRRGGCTNATQLLDKIYSAHLNVTSYAGASTLNPWIDSDYGNILGKYTDNSVINSYTTSSSAADVIIDSTVNFLTTVSVGDIIYKTSDSTYAKITAINSANQITLDQSIFGNASIGYKVETSDTAKGRYNLYDAGWTLIDNGPASGNFIPGTNSLLFNGSSEYIDTQVSPRALVGNSNAYTISAYVFIEEDGIEEGNYMIIGGMASDGTGGRWYFRVLYGNASFAYGSSASGNNTYSGTATPVTAGQWNHLAFTFNGTNTHKIYVNGGAAKYSTTSGSGQTITNVETAYIGALNYNNIAQNHFKGKIDEVMVWNTELTQEEVQAYADVVGSGADLIPNPNSITGLQLWNRLGD